LVITTAYSPGGPASARIAAGVEIHAILLEDF